MASRDMNDQVSIEDPRHPLTVFFGCGIGGTITVTTLANIDFTVPPSGSPFQGRLLLATAHNANTSVRVQVDEASHVVTFTTVPGGSDKVLVRIPIGVQLFEMTGVPQKTFYYECGSDHNILPHRIDYDPTKPEPGQTMVEVVLIVSPVPPRDATRATAQPNLTQLSKDVINVRRMQSGLRPLP